MKIIYDDEANVYIVKLEDYETVAYFNTNDITEVRTEFINRMTTLFNDTICKKFKVVAESRSNVKIEEE